MHRLLRILFCFGLIGFFNKAPGAEITKIVAARTNLLLTVEADQSSSSIVELAPFQNASDAATAVEPASLIAKKGKQTISIPRFDGSRDRIYSGFVLVEDHQSKGPVRFVDEWKNVSLNQDHYPHEKSKKGLQVQMVDDALALGVKHAALNLNLASMVTLDPETNDFRWTMDGRTFQFRRSVIEHLDSRIKPLSDASIIVTLILLNYEGSNADLNKVLLHPNYDKACPEHLSAFNTSTPEGLAWFKACIEFLADRYSAPQSQHGRAANYIVGNEVNSHWWWSNMGRVSMPEFARDYFRTVRVCHTAVRKFSSSARVFISLEHHWNIHFAAGNDTQAFAGHPFIDYLSQLSRTGGDFDWNIAFHPCPEDLFNCQTWKDKTATTNADNTPRITFKNIEILPRYIRRAPLLCHGQPRHIILSEQGFHSDGTQEGERAQATAYCYAYVKIARLDGIDAFILHRHVDHAAEGGLNLGLWRRKPESIADPMSKKPLYETFRMADTVQWKESFAFALPVIGVRSWNEIMK